MKNKRLLALIAAAAVAAVSTVSMSGSAAKPLRDASGDGIVYLNDTLVTISYLNGAYNPTNIKSFDFDGNGIISAMDTAKIQHYLLHNISEDDLPEASTETVSAVATTRTYMRHYYNSSNPASYTEYSLTVDPYDNTASDGISAYDDSGIIGDNDMIRDYDTAVVNLSVGGSGFIVSDHVIATAAHCVYNTSTNRFIDNTIKIVDSNNNRTFTPKYVDMCKTYVDPAHRDYDYALLYVEEDLSEYGRLQLGVATDDYINKHGDVIVSGFPQSYPSNYQGQPYGIRFKAKGKIIDATTGEIIYDADTFTGDSGAPVYAEEGFTTNSGERYDYKTVVAINVATSGDDNRGVKINPDILKFYNGNPNIEY